MGCQLGQCKFWHCGMTTIALDTFLLIIQTVSMENMLPKDAYIRQQEEFGQRLWGLMDELP